MNGHSNRDVTNIVPLPASLAGHRHKNHPIYFKPKQAPHDVRRACLASLIIFTMQQTAHNVPSTIFNHFTPDTHTNNQLTQLQQQLKTQLKTTKFNA